LGQTKVPTPGGRAAGTSTADLNTPPTKKKNTNTCCYWRRTSNTIGKGSEPMDAEYNPPIPPLGSTQGISPTPLLIVG
jgi:hypothetical protein